MIEAAIWLNVVAVGIVGLGLVEAVRSGRFGGTRWQDVRLAAMGAALILLAITSGFLAVTWFIVVFLWEVWEVLLIAFGVVAGIVVLAAWYRRRWPVFFASALVLASAVMLLAL